MLRRLFLTGALASLAFVATPQDASACWFGGCPSFGDYDREAIVSEFLEILQQYAPMIEQRIEQYCASADCQTSMQYKCENYGLFCPEQQQQEEPPVPPRGGTSVPEPSSLSLLAAGLVGIGFVRLRRREDEEE